MSVIINDMEMPGDCAECILRSVNCKYRKYLNFRPKECPLVEIPTPHGRLIDAEKLKENYPHDTDWKYPVNTNSYVVESIDKHPTVIEAEE